MSVEVSVNNYVNVSQNAEQAYGGQPNNSQQKYEETFMKNLEDCKNDHSQKADKHRSGYGSGQVQSGYGDRSYDDRSSDGKHQPSYAEFPEISKSLRESAEKLRDGYAHDKDQPYNDKDDKSYYGSDDKHDKSPMKYGEVAEKPDHKTSGYPDESASKCGEGDHSAYDAGEKSEEYGKSEAGYETMMSTLKDIISMLEDLLGHNESTGDDAYYGNDDHQTAGYDNSAGETDDDAYAEDSDEYAKDSGSPIEDLKQLVQKIQEIIEKLTAGETDYASEEPGYKSDKAEDKKPAALEIAYKLEKLADDIDARYEAGNRDKKAA